MSGLNLGVQDFIEKETEAPPDCATVAAVMTDPPRVQLLIDGATEAGAKGYRYLSSYAPAEGDRVFIIRTSGTIIVIGGLAE